MAFGLGREPFIKAGCEVDSCIATNDRSRFNESDAVIIHWESYKEDDLPSHRFSHQRFIFMIFETLPGGAGLPCFSSKPHFYNWTMSYRRDSDIYVGRPYGALRRHEGVPVADQLPAKLKEGERPLAPEQLLMKQRKYPHLANRTKLIAWFNSHCPTHSQREDYVQRLAQFIPVDIYGKCGPLQCLPRNDPQCDLRVLVNYKFYLAAENSLCPDYVTEKFYRALMNDVVPVVYGGADYAEYAPPNSYIDVADFDSPQDLANYLLLLNQNDALYQKYFAWKKEYQVIRRPLNGFCDLCRKLNDPTTESNKSYESLRQWWYEQVPCMPGSTYLESMPPLKTAQQPSQNQTSASTDAL